MLRRPPRSTRTDTLCPYTTLFRSPHCERWSPHHARLRPSRKDAFPSPVGRPAVLGSGDWETGSYFLRLDLIADHWSGSLNDEPREAVAINDRQHWSALVPQRLQRGERSEGRRAGKECVCTCRSR